MSSSFANSLRRLGEHCAIPGLIRYVVLFNALVFILHLLAPGYLSALELNPELILHGQAWRLLTWIFIPETLNPILIFFVLLFMLYLGDGVEAAVGPAKLTLFYGCGVLLCTVVSLAFGFAGNGAILSRGNTFLNLSLLLAFATLYPDFKVLVFFVLPLRVAWLALFSAAIMIIALVGQPLVVTATLGVVFLNYLLFFGKELSTHLRVLRSGIATFSGAPIRRKAESTSSGTLHHCEQCGRTEVSHPDLEFRVASNGIEYCREHLSKPPEAR